ncbi:MAG: response regulator transcription factor [Chitinophagaceae bacterium]|nr:response regulator transcription factor [Chitinophagaceae bacterium]
MGFLSLLQDQDNLQIVHTTTDPQKVLQFMEQKPVDLLLTDVMMTEMNGDELAKKVKARFPVVKILALSMSGQGDLVNAMIEDADICGYVLKNIGKKELIQATDKIAKGGIYFNDEVIAEMAKANKRKKANEDCHLTERETEIIRLIEREFSNKQIAESLFISERTVETHRKNIFRKTRTSSVIGLIKYAYEHKLV